MDLAELQAQNARLEKEQADSPQDDVSENEKIAVEDDTDPVTEVAEPEETGEEDLDAEPKVKADTEEWMQSEEPNSQDDVEIPGSAWKAAREHYKGKLSKATEEKNSEIEKLQAKVDALENGTPALKAKPKASDFVNHDDPQTAYIEALADHRFERLQTKREAEAAESHTRGQRQEQQQRLDQAVDKHYQEAAKLAQSSNITPEAYKSADLQVRQAVEAVIPTAGDAVTDGLIASLGQGSAKVFFNLGVNSTRRGKLQSLLKDDPSGLQAAVYLGELKGRLGAKQSKRTNAPKPATRLNGDKATGSVNSKSLKKAHDEAQKAGDVQGAIDAKAEAKQGGTDTTLW